MKHGSQVFLSYLFLLFCPVFLVGAQIINSPIIIVGGGLAGLTVAYELEKNNNDYLLIEANHRLGGRIKTLTPKQLKENGIEAGSYINTGAAFIDTQQPEIQALAKELGLELMSWDEDNKEDFLWNSYIYFDGKNYIPLSLWSDLYPQLFSTHINIMQKMKQNILEAQNGVQLKKQNFDNISFQAYLINLTKTDKRALTLLNAFFRPRVATYFAAPINKVSALAVLDYIDIDLKNQQILYLKEHDEKYRIKGGTESLIHALKTKVPSSKILKGTFLKELTKTSIGYTLNTSNKSGDKQTFTAEKVVLALGPQHLKWIKVDSSIFSSEFKNRIKTQKYGPITSFFLFFKSKPWIKNKHDGGVCLPDNICMWDAYNGHNTKAGALRVSIGGESSLDLSTQKNQNDFKNMILEKLEKLWPGTKVEYTSYWAQHYKEAWSQRPVGTYLNTLSYPTNFGQVYFAGEYYDDKDRDFMNGAVKSALRVVNWVK